MSRLLLMLLILLSPASFASSGLTGHTSDTGLLPPCDTASSTTATSDSATPCRPPDTGIAPGSGHTGAVGSADTGLTATTGGTGGIALDSGLYAPGGAAALVGETGGLRCDTARIGPLGWMLMLTLALVSLRARTLGLLLALSLGLSTAARAQDPAQTPHVALMLRGVAEQWSDPGIATVYRPGALLGSAGLLLPIKGAWKLDMEASYKRLTPTQGDGRMQLVPLSFLAELEIDLQSATAFVGLGPTLTVFSENHNPNKQGLGSTSGARGGIEARAGLRLDTGLVQPPMPPADRGGLRSLGIEIYLARRSQRPMKQGFELGAWRGSVGLGLNF